MSDFDSQAAEGLTRIMDYMGEAATYIPKVGPSVAITIEISHAMDEIEGTNQKQEARVTTRNVMVDVDPNSPTYSGVSSIDETALIEIDGVKWSIVTVNRLAKTNWTVTLKSVGSRGMTKDNYWKK